MYTLDTNALIYYLADEPSVVERVEAVLSKDSPAYISAITELELFSHAKLTPSDIEVIERILASLVIIPVDSRLARIAGELRSSRRLKTADSAIAATALLTGTTLLTRNIRDFRNVEKLQVEAI